MENSNPELNKNQMSAVTGGSVGTEKSVFSSWTVNSPYCKICGSAMSPVRSDYVCMNAKCAGFGAKKSRNEVNWL